MIQAQSLVSVDHGHRDSIVLPLLSYNRLHLYHIAARLLTCIQCQLLSTWIKEGLSRTRKGLHMKILFRTGSSTPHCALGKYPHARHPFEAPCDTKYYNYLASCIRLRPVASDSRTPAFEARSHFELEEASSCRLLLSWWYAKTLHDLSKGFVCVGLGQRVFILIAAGPDPD